MYVCMHACMQVRLGKRMCVWLTTYRSYRICGPANARVLSVLDILLMVIDPISEGWRKVEPVASFELNWSLAPLLHKSRLIVRRSYTVQKAKQPGFCYLTDRHMLLSDRWQGRIKAFRAHWSFSTCRDTVQKTGQRRRDLCQLSPS